VKVLLVGLYVVLGCVLAVPIGMVALIGVAAFWQPEFDRAHPDYAHFAGRFELARLALAAGQRSTVIDLAPLNRGAWRTACLFGGYSWPVARMKARGVIVSEQDRRRLEGATGLRVSPVEEFEMLIAFVDEEQRAHFIHFKEGIGPDGQHYEGCVSKPRTKVSVGPDSEAESQGP
jgi:hypothetical protein